jgi:hypothetical protein
MGTARKSEQKKRIALSWLEMQWVKHAVTKGIKVLFKVLHYKSKVHKIKKMKAEVKVKQVT